MRRLALLALAIATAGCGGSNDPTHETRTAVQWPHAAIGWVTRVPLAEGAQVVGVYIGRVHLIAPGAWTPLVDEGCWSVNGPEKVDRAEYWIEGATVAVAIVSGDPCASSDPAADELVPVRGHIPNYTSPLRIVWRG